MFFSEFEKASVNVLRITEANRFRLHWFQRTAGALTITICHYLYLCPGVRGGRDAQEFRISRLGIRRINRI